MCGRYTLTIDKKTIEHHFGAKFYVAQASCDWAPTYNAAPSQMMPIIRTYHEDRIELAKWGFVREDWKNSRIRPQNNARAYASRLAKQVSEESARRSATPRKKSTVKR